VTVIDASVYVHSLVSVGPAGDAARAEVRSQPPLDVPAIFAAEVTSALRGLVLRRALDAARARSALDRIRRTQTVLYPFEPFSARVWELRANLTVYDAWYVALAERLGTDLVTADERLAHAPGPRCPVRFIGSP
jgi:predicted nucleic acid-binding protein